MSSLQLNLPTMLPTLIKAEAKPNHRLFLKFDDGTEGLADVSHLAGRGVFRQWEKDGLFFLPKIDPETNALFWNETLDIDPLNLYLQIRGLSFEDWKAMRKPQARAHATD